jgi:hypothetical protein
MPGHHRMLVTAGFLGSVTYRTGTSLSRSGAATAT